MYPELKIFTAKAHPELAQEICDYLQMPLGKSVTTQFSDGEIFLSDI